MKFRVKQVNTPTRVRGGNAIGDVIEAPEWFGTRFDHLVEPVPMDDKALDLPPVDKQIRRTHNTVRTRPVNRRGR